MSTTNVRNPKRPEIERPATPKSRGVDHSIRHLGVGIDTARYGHHVSFLREDKQPAGPPLSITESRAGYDQLQQRLEQLQQRFPDARIHLRIDAAGQYAANLERFLRSLTQLPLSISVGEPKRNKDYHRAHSPKRKSDSTESLAMARYAVVEQPEESQGKPPEFAALHRVASRLQSQTKQTTRLTNQLHETLASSFPELATIIHDLSAGWVLKLLEKYPTAQRLAAARLSSIENTPYLPQELAKAIHEAAKLSVGGLAGGIAEELILELVSELRHSLAEEKRWRELLEKAFDSLPDGPHRQISTIKGIGKQTAAAIVATAVDIQRFETAAHFIGYYGIFPEELQSGVDKFGRPIPPGKKVMCRKGNDLVRGLLWQCAKCASAKNGGNPAVCALYARRLAAGDTPQVAWGYCMNKMLRQVFGVWTTGQAFNPQHEAKNQQKQETSGLKDESGALEEPTRNEVTEVPASLEPVSPKAVEPPCHSAPTNAPTQARRPIDYRALREQISLQQVLERVSPVPIHNAQHRGPCPLHEPNATNGRNFSANLKRHVFRCFDSECRAKGNVLDFWKAYRRMDVYEAAEDLAKTFQVEIPYLDDNTSQSTKRKGTKTGGHHPPNP